MALQLVPTEDGDFILKATVDNDQPGVTAAIVTILSKHNLLMRGGTRTVEKRQGADIHMVLQNEGPEININRVVSEIEGLKIPLHPSFETGGRFALSVCLTTVAASNAFFVALKKNMAMTNIPWFSVEDDGWVEMAIATELIERLPQQLEGQKVELRVLDSLARLKEVWNSSLHASGIRMRNARIGMCNRFQRG